MKLLIAVETYFYETPDGTIWTTGQNDYKFWMRYLEYFDDLFVVARVEKVDKKNSLWIKANGINVEFIKLPNYRGPWQYWKKYAELKKIISLAVKNTEVSILRGPGAIATLCWREIKRQGKKIYYEVCGDPWESLAPGTINSIARPIARLTGTYNLKRQCKEATALSYVTKEALQRRYKPGMNALSFAISDVSLPREAFITKDIDNNISIDIDQKSIIRILHAGSMETLYKGQEIQIKAMKLMLDKGYNNVRLDFAGDGRNRQYFESLVETLGIKENVGFLGMLPGPEALRKEMKSADFFILPSYVEGLPRALVEAMAMGLPCVATNVGGIPELLPVDDLVEPKSELDLAEKIIEVISDKSRMESMAERNHRVALEYSEDILNKKREQFYKYIISTSQ